MIRAAHVAPRVRRRERRLAEPERGDVLAGLVERDRERAIDHELLIFAGELDRIFDARPRGALVRDMARIELGVAITGVRRGRGTHQHDRDQGTHASSVRPRVSRASYLTEAISIDASSAVKN